MYIRYVQVTICRWFFFCFVKQESRHAPRRNDTVLNTNSCYTMMRMLATRAVIIGRCPWCTRVQINRDVIENLFSLFCSKWRAVLKTFARLFQIKVSESRSYLQTRKMEKRIQKGLLTTWKCLNYRNIHNSCHRVSSLRETRKKTISDTLACGSGATSLFLPYIF